MKKGQKKQIEIPEFVVLTKDRESFEGILQNGLSGLRTCYEKLREIEDLREVIPEKVKDIKPEPVNSFIDERIAEIVSTKMLTVEAKERAKKEWEDIRANATKKIDTIQKFFEAYPLANVIQVDGKLVCINYETVVFEGCKSRVPVETVKQHYELIQSVRDAIDALWTFERVNEWPGDNLFTLEQDMKMLGDPEQFARNWVYRIWQKEYREKHPYLNDAYAIGVKSSLAQQNTRLEEARKKHLAEHPEDFIELRKHDPYEKMGGSSLDYSVEMK